jgi:outer membrane lipoprotein SlyB
MLNPVTGIHRKKEKSSFPGMLDFGNLMFIYSKDMWTKPNKKDGTMKNLSITGFFLVGVTALLFNGCASSRSGEVYSRDHARKVHTVVAGTVESVKEITIEGTKTPVGTVAGGVAGGALGTTVGSGSGRTIATVLGALAGAAAGTAAEEGLTRKPGLEIVVNQDNGQTIVVVQEADVLFAPGDRVRIIKANDGTTRVSK